MNVNVLCLVLEKKMTRLFQVSVCCLFCVFWLLQLAVFVEACKCRAGYYYTGCCQVEEDDECCCGYCKKCVPGHFCPGGEQTRGIGPNRCPLTMEKEPNNNRKGLCFQCPSGKYSEVKAQSAESSCKNCIAGRYSYAGSEKCEFTAPDCPRGYYCEEGTTEIKPCPAGTFFSREGAKKLSQCIACGEGGYSFAGHFKCVAQDKCFKHHYCPDNSTKAVACKHDEYTKGRGHTKPSACLSCVEGFEPGAWNKEWGQNPCSSASSHSVFFFVPNDSSYSAFRLLPCSLLIAIYSSSHML